MVIGLMEGVLLMYLASTHSTHYILLLILKINLTYIIKLNLQCETPLTITDIYNYHDLMAYI